MAYIKLEGVCVFTDKKKKAIAFALVPVIAINVYAGCKMLNKTSKNIDIEPSTSIESLLEEIPGKTYLELDESTLELEEIDESQLIQDTNGDVILDNVIDEETEFTKLDRILRESGLDIETILKSEDRDSELYISALYTKLKRSSMPEDVIRNELSNIIIYGSNATCMTDEEWKYLFGNLSSTISIYDNVVDYYYPLAKYVHLYSCDLEHSPLFFDEDRVTCNDIQTKYNNLNLQIDIRSYFTDMVNVTNDNRLIEQFNTLLNSGIELDVLLNEIENVYVLSMIPMGMDYEDWISYFGNLIQTIDEDENVCMYYYDLAYYFHTLWCDLEHNLNVFDRYECDTYKLVLET